MQMKRNPQKLNPLQLKTLALFQALAEDSGRATPDGETGEVTIGSLPHAHGDHMHVGAYMMSTADATGMTNPAVWAALERKGLIKGAYPAALTLTQAGLTYETGVRDKVLHNAAHGAESH
ncbi:hypothetical protein CKO38_10440 [Rhodospirillum rubrum]|uniref:hypothetical protein n=1 Tax=Rhodospirillum rubrum TaxID=1085 RepID=UPI0019066179|nr:hypothetical protein [Rhodospirillum rubrum]MBK1663267.1 hypothetical protein [Rhodospirillum rubrum]MBK1677077.1 hypothetical protein [Rhodospirillum rubrum]